MLACSGRIIAAFPRVAMAIVDLLSNCFCLMVSALSEDTNHFMSIVYIYYVATKDLLVCSFVFCVQVFGSCEP